MTFCSSQNRLANGLIAELHSVHSVTKDSRNAGEREVILRLSSRGGLLTVVRIGHCGLDFAGGLTWPLFKPTVMPDFSATSFAILDDVGDGN